MSRAMILIRQDDGTFKQLECHRANYIDGFNDALDKVIEYTYSMLSDEKMELQQYLKKLRKDENEIYYNKQNGNYMNYKIDDIPSGIERIENGNIVFKET